LHLALENWVYRVRWYDTNLAPLLLGLALAFGLHDKHMVSLAMRRRLQLWLPVVAVAMSVGFPSALMFPLFGSSVWMSPLRLVCLAAVIVYVHGLITYRHALFAIATASCLTAAGLGVSAPAIGQSLVGGWSVAVDITRRLVPRTSTHWGIVSVVAAFVLLILGAIISVLKTRQIRDSAEGAASFAPTLLPGGGKDQLMA